MTTSQENLLTALRLTAGAPAAALELLGESRFAPRQQLCAALDAALQSADWLSLLPALNHDSVAERLYWLSSLLLDAQKMQQGISLLTNVDAWALVQRVANALSSSRLQAMIRDACVCREQLLNVTGLNRELMLNDLLLRWEHWLQPTSVMPIHHL